MWNQREIRQKPAKPSVEEAELLAIQAVEWLLGDEEISMRFLALSGMTADMLAGAVAAQDHEFLGGVLDFVLNNEPDLVAFAQAREMAPERVVTLRRLLGGAQDWG